MGNKGWGKPFTFYVPVDNKFQAVKEFQMMQKWRRWLSRFLFCFLFCNSVTSGKSSRWLEALLTFRSFSRTEMVRNSRRLLLTGTDGDDFTLLNGWKDWLSYKTILSDCLFSSRPAVRWQLRTPKSFFSFSFPPLWIQISTEAFLKE